MTPALQAYMSANTIALIAAILLMIRERKRLLPLQPEYWRYLAAPWKLATFTVTAVAMTVIAPYTGDPTWDSLKLHCSLCRSCCW